MRGRFQLVFWMVVLGSLVPLFPNLDTAFQGMNAWHSFQYLGLLWLMNRNSYDRGEIRNGFFDSLMQPGRHKRFYGVALLATFSVIALVLGVVIRQAAPEHPEVQWKWLNGTTAVVVLGVLLMLLGPSGADDSSSALLIHKNQDSGTDPGALYRHCR